MWEYVGVAIIPVNQNNDHTKKIGRYGSQFISGFWLELVHIFLLLIREKSMYRAFIELCFGSVGLELTRKSQ